MSILSMLPNPYNKNSKLSDLAKGAEVVEEGLSFPVIVKNVVFLIVIGFLLKEFLHIPLNIIGIFIGIEISITILGGYIKFKKLKAIENIEERSEGYKYKSTLIISQRYDLIKTVLGLVGNITSAIIVFSFFSNELNNFITDNKIVGKFTNGNLLLICLSVCLIARIAEIIIKIIQYKLINNIEENNDFAEIERSRLLIQKKLELVNFVPMFFIIAFILYIMGIPLYILSIFIVIIFVMILLSIIEIKKISNVNFNNDENHESVVENKIEVYEDEVVEDSLFGISVVATGFKDMFKSSGSATFGVGKNYNSENTLLITNHRLLFIEVPITGGNNIVGNTDYVEQNFFFNRGEIREKGEALLRDNSIEQILGYTKKSASYEDIKVLTLKYTEIIIEKNSGEKMGYMFLDKEYIDVIKKCLEKHLVSKFIIKQ